MIFYTADLHLGYFPILHDTARPFTGVPEMDEALISNWNARVGADDSVYIVGENPSGCCASRNTLTA